MRFQITGRRARLIILLIWVLALTTTVPWPMYFHLVSAFPSEPDVQLCVEEWPEGAEVQQTVYFIVANVVLCYLFPLTLVCLCYVMIWVKGIDGGAIKSPRRRKKTTCCYANVGLDLCSVEPVHSDREQGRPVGAHPATIQGIFKEKERFARC